MIPYKGKVTLDRTLKYIEDNMSYIWMAELKSYNFDNLKFRLDEENLSEILFKFARKNLTPDKLSQVLSFCEYLSLDLVNVQNKQVFNEFIDLYLKYIDIFPTNEVFSNLISAFNDKKIAVEYLRYIFSNKKIYHIEALNHLVNYLIKARQYYVDDRALLSSAINLVNSISDEDLTLCDEQSIKKMAEKKLLDDKKSNGIYDIDQFTLEELDRKLSEFEAISSQLENLVEITDEQIKTMQEESKKSNDDIVNIRIKTLKTLKIEANKIISNFNKTYLELLSKEKESIINQKDVLIADIDTEVQKKKLELQNIASDVGRRIALELGRIRNQSDYSIERMKDFVENNEEVKKIFEVASQDEAFLNRLAKIDSMPTQQVNISPVTPGQSIVTGSQVIAAPSIIIPSEERVVEEKINYYFDKTIPFKDRFNELIGKKQEDIEKTGAIYHEKFDDLLTIVLNNNTPYMYGPSGCGKTFMIEHQLAKLLGLDVVTNGYIMYETDILGFNNANGIYVPSNFYRCYKYGDMIFLDELDNSISSSTITLNSFIGKGENSSYTFPNGDRVKRHPNFRIITAGNTRGNGRTVSHNTRQKLDEAVLQRLTPLEIDYDNRIEKDILKDYPDWYNFAINFRTALKGIEIDGSDGPNYNGTITTRDIVSIKQYKDDDSFSDEKILEYEVIENKDVDYLTEIINGMESLKDQGKFTKSGAKLLEKFKSLSRNRRY